jgi:eukaryotic-like serine/threonine-protein kinase
MAQAAQIESETGGVRVATLGSHIDILVDRPLTDLRTPYAGAYVAVDRELPAANLLALVCDPRTPPRLELLEGLRGMRLDGMLTPLEWGIVDWPLMGRRCFAILYDRPVGGAIYQGDDASGEPPLVTSMDRHAGPINEDNLIHEVLPPLVAALRELFSAGATHRAVRATNIFYRDAARRIAVFGDCCATPPALCQPLVYETIESGMAGAWGRGEGAPSNDLYALGVTLVFLLLGRNPVAHLTDEQLLLEKINRGSYGAIVGAERLSMTMIEPVRGLLTDDTKERWSVQDLELWVQGRRLSPKQPALPRRASRPLEFDGEGYLTARSLAHALARKPAAVSQILKGGDFEVWMQRSLGDPERTKAVSSALSEAHELSGGSHDERLAARLATALDPAAPVRYKGFAAAIDGFGAALAGAFRGQGSVQLISETILARLPVFWFSAQPSLRPEQVPVLKTFERLRFHLEDQRPGFGVERVLYEMNTSLHCLSPLIEGYYVLDPADALGAIESALKALPSEELQVDRHLAAFIVARFKLVNNEWVDPLASAEPSDRALGALRLLAKLQPLRGPKSVRQIALRLARQLPQAFQNFRNRVRRQELLERLPAVAETGDLVELLSLVDSLAERQRDALGFSAAAMEYSGIERALDGLRADGSRRAQRSAILGARIASATAMFLAWLSGLALLVLMS